MPACCRAGRCGEETRSGSNNSGNRACSFHQGSRRTSEESSRETTTSRPEWPAGSDGGSRPSVCLPGGRTRTPKGPSIMNQQHTIHLSSWARLVGLALLLGVGLLASLGLTSRTAHAQPAATIPVGTCDDATLRNAINNATSGDTIKFGCSGTITLGSTLGISKNLTLDGSGQQVTLSGGGSVQVLSVSSGVTFTLNALTVAHGSAPNGGGLSNSGGTVSISNSTFANNNAPHGDGLYSTGGTANSTNSNFANNSAGLFGGRDLLHGHRATVGIAQSIA